MPAVTASVTLASFPSDSIFEFLIAAVFARPPPFLGVGVILVVADVNRALRHRRRRAGDARLTG